MTGSLEQAKNPRSGRPLKVSPEVKAVVERQLQADDETSVAQL